MSKRSKPPAKYRGLSFPVPLLEEIKNHISNKPEYRSVSEFIRESIRKNMNNVNVTKDRINDSMLNTINKNTSDNLQELNQQLLKMDNSIKDNYSNLKEQLSGIINILVSISQKIDTSPKKVSK